MGIYGRTLDGALNQKRACGETTWKLRGNYSGCCVLIREIRLPSPALVIPRARPLLSV